MAIYSQPARDNHLNHRNMSCKTENHVSTLHDAKPPKSMRKPPPLQFEDKNGTNKITFMVNHQRPTTKPSSSRQPCLCATKCLVHPLDPGGCATEWEPKRRWLRRLAAVPKPPRNRGARPKCRKCTLVVAIASNRKNNTGNVDTTPTNVQNPLPTRVITGAPPRARPHVTFHTTTPKRVPCTRVHKKKMDAPIRVPCTRVHKKTIGTKLPPLQSLDPPNQTP